MTNKASSQKRSRNEFRGTTYMLMCVQIELLWLYSMFYLHTKGEVCVCVGERERDFMCVCGCACAVVICFCRLIFSIYVLLRHITICVKHNSKGDRLLLTNIFNTSVVQITLSNENYLLPFSRQWNLYVFLLKATFSNNLALTLTFFFNPWKIKFCCGTNGRDHISTKTFQQYTS